MLNNDQLNAWISEHCDSDEHAVDGGKSIPYVGWYWRFVDFRSGRVPIGDCGDFIGFMQRNKWDYQERYLTQTELDTVLGHLTAAMDDHSRKWEHLRKLWDYMQTLTIDP